MEAILITIGVAGIVAAVYLVTYNGLRAAETRVEQGWSGIEVQLRRRHDLLPQLVQAVRRAIGHEDVVFERITEARTEAVKALAGHVPDTMAAAEKRLTAALRGIYALGESNPSITATGNIETYQRQLEETEDQIAAARRLYNGNVQALNQRTVTFPGNLVAGAHGIRPARPFEIAESELDAVRATPVAEL